VGPDPISLVDCRPKEGFSLNPCLVLYAHSEYPYLVRMEDVTTPFKTGFRWSLYSSLALTIFICGAVLSGWFDFVNSGDIEYYTVLGICFTIVFASITGALLYFRRRNESLLTFGEGLSIGIFMGIFSAVILAIAVYLVLTFTLPEAVPTTEEISIEEDVVRLPVALAFGTAIPTFLGFLGTGFVMSLILKKD